MTDVVSAFSLVLAPNTPAGVVFFLDCPLGWSDVEQIILNFPPGCASLVGVRVEYSLNPVYPVQSGTYFTLDDYTLVIPVTNQQQGGQWRITGYNHDVFAHTVTAYFFWNHLTAAQLASQSPLISL